MENYDELSEENLQLKEGFAVWNEHPGYTIEIINKQLSVFDMFIETYERNGKIYFRVLSK